MGRVTLQCELNVKAPEYTQLEYDNLQLLQAADIKMLAAI